MGDRCGAELERAECVEMMVLESCLQGGGPLKASSSGRYLRGGCLLQWWNFMAMSAGKLSVRVEKKSPRR